MQIKNKKKSIIKSKNKISLEEVILFSDFYSASIQAGVDGPTAFLQSAKFTNEKAKEFKA